MDGYISGMSEMVCSSTNAAIQVLNSSRALAQLSVGLDHDPHCRTHNTVGRKGRIFHWLKLHNTGAPMRLKSIINIPHTHTYIYIIIYISTIIFDYTYIIYIHLLAFSLHLYIIHVWRDVYWDVGGNGFRLPENKKKSSCLPCSSSS